MLDDVRYALRQLRKNPGFAVVSVLTLALGIGAAAAMFGLIQGVLLSPPPYVQPDRIVLVAPARANGQPYTRGATIGQWMAWRAGSRTIETPALYSWGFDFLVLPDGSRSMGGMYITKNYFSVMGLKPMLGREFVDSELARGDKPPTAVVIGYELWKRQFNGDPAIIGKPIKMSRSKVPLPVVGVMPPGVRFLPDPSDESEPNYDVNAFVDFWLAMAPDESKPGIGNWQAVSRLRDGVSLAQAQAEIAALTVSQASADANLRGLTATVRALPDELNQQGRTLLLPLFGAVALLFLIACGNVAGLLLARGLQRGQEYAMRAALGAGRARLFRQVLTESVVLACVGAVFGAAVAVGVVSLLKAIGGHAVPRLDAVSVGWPVLLFGFVAALLAAGLAGTIPAVRASLPDRFQGLALAGVRSSVGLAERRLLGAVATLQIVLTVALLAGAALLVRTAHNLSNVRPGYDTEKILAMTVTAVQRDGWKDFHTRALERVAKLPGVSHAAFVWGLPLTGNKWPAEVEIIGSAAAQPGSTSVADRLRLPFRAVTPDYFAAMGMSVVDGRGFRATDDEKAPQVVMINQALARKYFGNANPIGRTIRQAGDTDPKHWMSVIGIVADTRTEDLSQAAEPEVYLSLWQATAFSKHLIVRTTADPRTLTAQVRSELHAVDPTAAVERVQTMEEIRAASVAPRTFAMNLLTGFSVAATLLALVGLYGVLSLSVGSRTREIAVRKAIGAQANQILRMIVGEGFWLIGIGVVLGTVVALLLGPALQALLFDVRPTDPVTLAGAALVFTALALIACVVPAWRAVRVDLMEALRHE